MRELSIPLNSSTEKGRAAPAPSFAARVRPLLTALNLHFAGACLLALINVYLLLHLFLAWRQTANNDANALAEQTVQRETAEIAAQPLRGLDMKLKKATEDADRFSDKRLPFADSQVLAELGALAKKQNVKLTRVQYPQVPVLTGTAHELTEVRMDASLSGDYRPLVQFVNALERDKVFFVIDGVTLSGQQSGTVGLRLRLTTYLRPAHAGEVSKNVVVQDPADPGSLKVVPASVAARPGAGYAAGNAEGRACAMKLGADDRKKVILASVLGGIAAICCGYYLYNAFSGPSTPAAPAAAAPTVAAPVATSVPSQVAVTRSVPGGVARKVAITAGQLDPTLHMESMDVTESLAYTGTGRNIFSPNSAPPVALPKPLASARPVGPVATPGPVGPVGPPPPPPIDLKFFGTETAANGSRQAFLLHGEDVYVASNGEIVGRRYKVISIGTNSVEVEDMPNNNRQMLPLEAR